MRLPIMKRKILVAIVALIISLSIFGFGCSSRNYSVSMRSDGGYVLDVTVYKRHWKLITAEGVFPLEKTRFVINIAGKGHDWSFRNQAGFYYTIDEITTNIHDWDLGYAWVDTLQKNLYVNLFWVQAPDRLVPSDVNGKYSLSGQ